MEPVKSVNLWCALTSAEYAHRRDYCSSHPRVTSEFLHELGMNARFSCQELSIHPEQDGWMIEIFGTDMESVGDRVQILIPKDCREPVKIIKDRVGIREYHH